MIRIGPKARIHGMAPELTFANTVLLGILVKHGVVMILTHGVDGVHTRASIHYCGGAEDLVFAGTYEADKKGAIVQELKESIGQDFDVLFENPGEPNEHIHIEWQPKEPFK